MSSTARLRPFTWADVPALAVLQAQVAGTTPGLDAARELTRALRDPALRPERDLTLAESNGDLAGYCLLSVEEPIGRGVLGGGVRPDRRRLGVGRALLTAAIAHCRALGLRVVHVDVPESEHAAQALLASTGFAHVRTHLHLARGAGPAAVPTPAGVTLRLATPADVPRLTALQNAAFAGSWGFCPNTPEEVAYRAFGRDPEHPDAIVLAEGDGELLAYCWTRVEHALTGSVGMVGVAPASQGQGLGRIVTAAAVNELAGRGVAAIQITVDSENTPAVRLYDTLGFGLGWRSLWYEREV